MKVVIVKEAPNIHLTDFIDEVKKNYDGIVTKLNLLDRFSKNKINTRLLSKINELGKELEDGMFNDVLTMLDIKHSNEVIFIYMNNEDKIKILQERYQTITVDKDFIFDIIEYKEDKVQELISKLV